MEIDDRSATHDIDVGDRRIADLHPAVAFDEFDALLLAGAMRPLDRTVHRPAVPIRALVLAFAELVGDDDEMIAASYCFQSIISRLAVTTLTGAVVLGRAPQYTSADLRWGNGVDGPAIGIGLAPLCPTSPDQALDHLLGTVAELAAAMRAEIRIAHRLLMGNAAAALLATLRRIVALGDVDPRSCRALADRAIDELGRPVVATLVELDGWTTFRRRTCCLLRFAGARGVCDECSFLDPSAFLDAQRSVRSGLAR